MRKKHPLKTAILLVACLGFVNARAQVIVSTDFTSDSLQKAELHNIWSVTNRNKAYEKVSVRPDMAINRVRAVGGVKKTVNGKDVPDLAFDPCAYDSATNTYVYNWKVLTDRIDEYVNANAKIFQLVIDQPPWCFQHGYTFIPAGTRDNIHFREDEIVSKYGNALPPADKEAYAEFIKAMMTELIAKYGKEQVLSWRIRVASEIETPDHWRGTKQDFIEHFANTVTAVRAVLPEAKVGVHTRGYDFLYKKGNVLNYKGEPYASFAKDLIEYCADNNIQYDFWGNSDYIVTTNDGHVDMENKYKDLFAGFVEHPKWNKNATLDIMEYYVVTTMNGPDGKGWIPCVTTHMEIMDLALSNQFYRNADKGLQYIYRWFINKDTRDTPGIEVLNTMVGKTRYETVRKGTPKTANNSIDAIFGKEAENYDALIYNYNKKSFNYIADEDVSLNLVTNAPVGTTYYYRTVSYDKTNNKHGVFFDGKNPSEYVKDGFEWMGTWYRVIKPEHLVEYRDFPEPEPHKYTNWYTVKTVARTDGKPGSSIALDTKLPSFSFKKFEFRTELKGELAQFYKLNITANNGTVIKFTDLDEYEDGTSVSLTAIPDSSYKFNNWSGDISGTSETIIIVVDGNKNISANFSQIPTSIHNNKLVNTILVYPNPNSNGRFAINRSCLWTVYTLNDLKLKQGFGKVIDLPNIPNGMYIIQADNTYQKVLIQK